MPETRKGSASRSRSSSKPKWAVTKSLIGVLVISLLLITGVAEMPLMPNPWPMRIVQGTLLSGWFLVLAVASYQENLLKVLLRGPNPWMVALITWHFIGIASAPDPRWAIARCLLMMLGFSIYILAGYAIPSKSLSWVCNGAIGIGVCQAFIGFAQFGQGEEAANSKIYSTFGNHESLGSFLLILIFPAIALALQADLDYRTRLISQVSAVILVGALLIARTRSAWIGLVAGILFMILIASKHGNLRFDPKRKVNIIGPGAVIAAAIAVLVAVGDLTPILDERMDTFHFLQEDTSFIDRLNQWRGAILATCERPLTGWGTGSWPIVQSLWTHTADEPFTVLRYGTGHSNLAHNVWVQTAAELGVVGLGLFVGTLVAFIQTIMTRLATVGIDRFNRALMLGAAAGIFASIIDGMGSPAHVFSSVLIQVWFWMGLGMAAVRSSLPSGQTSDGEGTKHASAWVPFAFAIVCALIPLGFGLRLKAGQKTILPPTVTIQTENVKRQDGSPGLQAVAVVKNPDGVERPSAPGIEWTMSGLTETEQTAIDLDGGGTESVVTGRMVPGVSPQLTATWRDETGRKITARYP